jgi:hypothetical protein
MYRTHESLGARLPQGDVQDKEAAAILEDRHGFTRSRNPALLVSGVTLRLDGLGSQNKFEIQPAASVALWI